MHNSIELFNFQGHELRVVIIDGKPWIVAKDAANILLYQNTKDAIIRHCKNACCIGDLLKGRESRPFDLHPQTKLIHKRDFYSLVLGSELPEAEQFKDHVLDIYVKYEEGKHEIPQSFADALELAAKTVREKEALKLTVRDQAKVIEVEVPKAKKYTRFIDTGKNLTMGEAANQLGIGRNTFMEQLRDLDYLQINNLPYQRHINAGLMSTAMDDKGYVFAVFTPKGFDHVASKHFNRTPLNF